MRSPPGKPKEGACLYERTQDGRTFIKATCKAFNDVRNSRLECRGGGDIVRVNTVLQFGERMLELKVYITK